MTTAPTSPPTATWYFDVISPFAYLALCEIEDLAKSVAITCRPVLFAGLLQHWKHLGPAEIPPKRIHTYRLCVFEAQRRGIPFRFPPAHPFNPVKPLRLLTALDANLHAVRTVMDCIWREGLDLGTDAGWGATCTRLGLDTAAAAALVDAPETKFRLRTSTEEAIAAGLFGVPTLRIDDELFWGLDALPMAQAYLADRTLFQSGELRRVGTIEASSSRVPLAGSQR